VKLIVDLSNLANAPEVTYTILHIKYAYKKDGFGQYL